MKIMEAAKLFDRSFPANGMLECSDQTVGRVCVVLAGSFIDYNGRAEVLRTGVVVYRPPEARTLIRFGPLGMRSMTVELGANDLEWLHQAGVLPNHAVSARSPRCFALAARITDEKSGQDSISQLVTEGLLLELIGEVGRAASPIRRRRAPAWLKHTHTRISCETATPRSIAEYAQAAGVHPSHLARSFRAYYGVSIGEYVRNSRVQRAASVIVSGRSRLVDVAAECGFADHAHMTNCRWVHGNVTVKICGYSHLHEIQDRLDRLVHP